MRFFLPTASFQQLSMETEAETQKLCPDAGAFAGTDQLDDAQTELNE
jgi:hypothetical protein